MKSVMVRLTEYSQSARGVDKNIVDYLLENARKASNSTIREISQATFTSDSSVVRLIKKLGFSGVREFNQALVYEIAMIEQDFKLKENEVGQDDSLEDVVNNATSRTLLSIENTQKLIDFDVLQECVNLIRNSRTIHLFGIGASLLVAKDAYLKFLRVDKSCVLNDDSHSALIQARNIKREDLVIAISYSGMTEEVLRCVKIAHEKKVPIIAITRFEVNSLSQMADYVLSISSTEYLFRSGAMSSRISSLYLIDILYEAYIRESYIESIEQFQKTHIEKT